MVSYVYNICILHTYVYHYSFTETVNIILYCTLFHIIIIIIIIISVFIPAQSL